MSESNILIIIVVLMLGQAIQGATVYSVIKLLTGGKAVLFERREESDEEGPRIRGIR
jgi:hypothetical protein